MATDPYRDTARYHLDRELTAAREAMPPTPSGGWVRSIRTALGMSGADLARRLGVTRARVLKIEEDEPRGAVTLATLEQAAEALGCRLVYSLVPESSLEAFVTRQAAQVAQSELAAVDHTMDLEQQKPDGTDDQQLLRSRIEQLKASSQLWRMQP